MPTLYKNEYFNGTEMVLIGINDVRGIYAVLNNDYTLARWVYEIKAEYTNIYETHGFVVPIQSTQIQDYYYMQAHDNNIKEFFINGRSIICSDDFDDEQRIKWIMGFNRKLSQGFEAIIANLCETDVDTGSLLALVYWYLQDIYGGLDAKEISN